MTRSINIESFVIFVSHRKIRYSIFKMETKPRSLVFLAKAFKKIFVLCLAWEDNRTQVIIKPEFSALSWIRKLDPQNIFQ